MSKSVKKIIGVAVAIAIPFVAPAIAGSIGLSAAVGKIAGSAIVGAAMGAGGAAVSGGDVGRGALFGGLGGGIAGYATPAAATAGTSTGATAAPGVTTAAAPAAAAAPVTGATAAAPGAAAGLQEIVVTGTRAGLGGGAATSGLSSAAAAYDAAPEGSIVNRQTGEISTPTAAAPAPTAGTAAAPPKTFLETLKSVPGEIAKKFSNPTALADLTLRAAGQIAGSLAAGSGLSPEEESLLSAQRAELEALRGTNQELFNQRLQAAQDMLGSAKYFDPEYFGLQSARRARMAGVAAEREGTRGLRGERLAAEQRRYRLGTARNVGTAYDVGFGQGVAGRQGALQAGLQMFPTTGPSTMGEAQNLASLYGTRAARRTEQAGQIGDLFGSVTGQRKAGLSGTEDYETRIRRLEGLFPKG